MPSLSLWAPSSASLVGGGSVLLSPLTFPCQPCSMIRGEMGGQGLLRSSPEAPLASVTLLPRRHSGRTTGTAACARWSGELLPSGVLAATTTPRAPPTSDHFLAEHLRSVAGFFLEPSSRRSLHLRLLLPSAALPSSSQKPAKNPPSWPACFCGVSRSLAAHSCCIS